MRLGVGHPVFMSTTHAILDFAAQGAHMWFAKDLFLIVSDNFALIRKHSA